MPVSPVVCPKEPLSRGLDVSVSISRPITEIATDMTMICFVTPDVEFSAGNGRVQFFSTMKALSAAVPANSAAYWAGNAFFSRDDRPKTLAVGRVFTEPTAAELTGGQAALSGLANVTDGAFDIEVNDALVSVSGLSFDGTPTIAEVAEALNAALASKGVTAAASGNALRLATTQAGDGASLGYAAAPASGTDVSALLGLTPAKAASNIPGYTPGDLVSEIGLIQTAARCAGNAVYGWVIDARYRDTDEQKAVADWAEGQNPAIFGACTNAPNAYDTANTTNIGYYAMNGGYRRTFTFYHDNPQVYPEMSYLALALSVNYALANSTLTMKFKQLPGIGTVPLTETQLAALESRRINTYVSIGNTSSVIREGVQAASDWFTDSLVNLDNYREELQVEVYNVFLRNKKVPYTQAGQNLLVSAAAKINRRYTDNGTFAPRDVESDATETGYDTLPATSITPASVAGATTSERAARIAPPIAITAYEAGAFHSVAIAVSVYN